MTGRHCGPKQKLRAGYRAPSLQRTSYLRTLLLCEATSIFDRRVWYPVLSLRMCALCMYSKIGHHPHPPGYPCAKFHFCHAPHYWDSPLRKIRYSVTQSLTQSLIRLIWYPGNWSFRFRTVINALNYVMFPVPINNLHFEMWTAGCFVGCTCEPAEKWPRWSRGTWLYSMG